MSSYEDLVRAARPISVASVRVLHADTDAMGIVYHGAYLRWLEQARVEFMRRQGVLYRDMEARGLGLPVVELSVRYRASAVYDEPIDLQVALVTLKRAQLAFGYRLRVPEDGAVSGRGGREVLVATTRHACTALETGRPTPFPPEVVSILRSCYTGPA